VTLCRVHSYTSPFLGVVVDGSPGWSILYTSPYLGRSEPCFTYQNEVTTAANISTVTFTVSNASNFVGPFGAIEYDSRSYTYYL
jgi:hypothetical protein